jgi:hypothetical protein
MGAQDRKDGGREGPARRPPSRVGSTGAGRVTLVRGRHTWRFEFGAGDRPALLEALEALSQRSDCPFDAFDAALVGHEARHGADHGRGAGDGAGDGLMEAA